jgi:hypothetical protein
MEPPINEDATANQKKSNKRISSMPNLACCRNRERNVAARQGFDAMSPARISAVVMHGVLGRGMLQCNSSVVSLRMWKSKSGNIRARDEPHP